MQEMTSQEDCSLSVLIIARYGLYQKKKGSRHFREQLSVLIIARYGLYHFIIPYGAKVDFSLSVLIIARYGLYQSCVERL